MNQITTPANYTSTMKALQNTEAIMAAAILPAGGYRSEGREAAAKDWRAVAIEVRKHARAYPKFYYYVALDPVDMSDDPPLQQRRRHQHQRGPTPEGFQERAQEPCEAGGSRLSYPATKNRRTV